MEHLTKYNHRPNWVDVTCQFGINIWSRVRDLLYPINCIVTVRHDEIEDSISQQSRQCSVSDSLSLINKDTDETHRREIYTIIQTGHEKNGDWYDYHN